MPPSSVLAATNSFATRFIPSCSELTMQTSASRKSATSLRSFSAPLRYRIGPSAGPWPWRSLMARHARVDFALHVGIALQLGPRRHADLDEGKPPLEVGMTQQQAVDGVETFGDALRVVQPIHADADQHPPPEAGTPS